MMNIQSTPVSVLSAETSIFDIFHRCLSNDFIDSVREHGVLQPVYAVEQPGGYDLVAGFKRWRAAYKAGCCDIPAVILSTETPAAELLNIRLALDSSDTPMPVMAQAGLVQLASELLDDPFSWLCRPTLRRFLPMNRDIYDRLLLLACTGANMKEYYRKYNAPLATVSVVLRQEHEFREHLANWALRYRIRPIELEKLLNGTIDCAKRHGHSVAEIWGAIAAGQPAESEGHERVVYLLQVKERLTEMRYPYLNSLQGRCTDAVGILEKTCGTTVTFDPSFESDTVTISFSASSMDEYDLTVSRLQDDTARKAIMTVLVHE